MMIFFFAITIIIRHVVRRDCRHYLRLLRHDIRRYFDISSVFIFTPLSVFATPLPTLLCRAHVSFAIADTPRLPFTPPRHRHAFGDALFRLRAITPPPSISRDVATFRLSLAAIIFASRSPRAVHATFSIRRRCLRFDILLREAPADAGDAAQPLMLRVRLSRARGVAATAEAVFTSPRFTLRLLTCCYED